MTANTGSKALDDVGRSGDQSIDAQMDRASRALIETKYFETERIAARCLRLARQQRDFERMARICLPLQEARRQIRMMALDAGPAGLVQAGGDVPKRIAPGLYLVQPPMIGAEARTLAEHATRQQVPAFVLCREPMTRDGLWPLVTVGPITFRVKVPPPSPLERVEERVTKDAWASVPDASWFERASEALGDSGRGKLPEVEHPDYRVDDLLDLVEAHPAHEKLHQWLAEACREAMGSPPPEGLRRPSVADDLFGF